MKIKKIKIIPKNRARENEWRWKGVSYKKDKIKLLSTVNVRYFDTWDEICVTKILLEIYITNWILLNRAYINKSF